MKRFIVVLLLLCLATAVHALPPFKQPPSGSPCSGFDYNWVHFDESCDTNGDGSYSNGEICRSNCRANRSLCENGCNSNPVCIGGCMATENNCLDNCPDD